MHHNLKACFKVNPPRLVINELAAQSAFQEKDAPDSVHAREATS